VVCDTGPLIALTLLERFDLLTKRYRPLVPWAVWEEWSQGRQRGVMEKLPPEYEVVVHPTGSASLMPGLGLGESEVIRTAVEKGISLVLMDEKRGRQKARKDYGLVPLGTAGLLVQAKQRGEIRDLGEAFDILQKKSYWIGPEVVDWALKAAGESK
jgi:predicted nucleic acid-binding protein